MPFNWKDLTPVAMLALDEFVLWVNAETPYKTAKEYIDAVKAGGTDKFKMGGTGSKQEDQIITVGAREGDRRQDSPTCRSRAAATWRCSWSASTSTRRVNNPIEAVAQWRAGDAAAAVRLRRQAHAATRSKVTDDMAWSDIPTCKEAGRRHRVPDAARHLHAAGRHARSRSTFYVDLFKKVRETPEWKEFMEKGAFNHDLHDRRRVSRRGSARPKSTHQRR